MSAILGLDLSTRAAAAVVVPLDWAGDWSRVRWTVAGEALTKGASDYDRARRTETIATKIVAFARETGSVDARLEGYAFDQKTAAHTLGELGGVVRLELLRAGVSIHTSNMSSARKLLLGKLPPAKRFTPKGQPFVSAKQACVLALAAAGAPDEWIQQKGLDLVDAFVAANFGLSFVGGAHCFAQEPPLKPKRGRKAS